jgi:hypothetical protein
MPSKAPSKNHKKVKPKRPAARTARGGARSGRPKAPTARVRPGAPARTPPRPGFVPRALPVADDEDVLMAHGADHGAGFGRCGGRILGSKLEQTICDRLSNAGVAHSHSPRHFEVTMQEEQVAAYAPMIVLRGRGREGKSVVIEAADEVDAPILKKVVAFRAQYGLEFYVILVATDEVLEEVELAAYDEACAASNINTLISRLAE